MSNRELRALVVYNLTLQHYEAGRQDKCKLQVYRKVVSKQFPISERTFFRYLGIASNMASKVNSTLKPIQLTLF